MPGFDKTGPMGQGPITGHGQGDCGVSGNYSRPRFGFLGGFGRGWRHRNFATGMPGRFMGRWFNRYEPENLSSQEKVKLLQDEENYFEEKLKKVREEIDRLGKNNSKTLSKP